MRDRPIQPLPQDVRWQVNAELQDSQMSMLDDNARFMVRRMVAEAYSKGFEHGWTAGQHDAAIDKSIAFDAAAEEVD